MIQKKETEKSITAEELTEEIGDALRPADAQNPAPSEKETIPVPDLDAIVKEEIETGEEASLPFEEALRQMQEVLDPENDSLKEEASSFSESHSPSVPLSDPSGASSETEDLSSVDTDDLNPEDENVLEKTDPDVAEPNDIGDSIASADVTEAASSVEAEALSETDDAEAVPEPETGNEPSDDTVGSEAKENERVEPDQEVMSESASDEKPAFADETSEEPFSEEADRELNGVENPLTAPRAKVDGLCLLAPVVEDPHLVKAACEMCDNIRSKLSAVYDNCIVSFVSPSREDGRSSVALLTALALAEDYNILLADCDFYRPSLHKYFNCMNKKGVRNVIAGECDIRDVILNTDIPRLKFVTSGLGADYREINAKDIVQVLEPVQSDYDFILLDTTSVNKAPYVACLAGLSYQSVMVVRIGSTSYVSLENAIHKLEKKNASILGVVVNGK